MQSVEIVVHLAALLHVQDPPRAMREAYERTNVHGTRVVVEAARDAGAGRLVFFSTIAVYGEASGQVFREESPMAPRTPYAETKAEAERIVLGARRSDSKPLGVVLRPGSVYGARVKGNYRRLVRALARGRFIKIGPGHNRRAMVYDRDVADAAVRAAMCARAGGCVYNVSDGEEHTLTEIIAAICEALGRPTPRFLVPLRLVRGAVGLVEDVASLIGMRPPIQRATIDKYTEDIAVDSRRIREELGFAPRYDLRAGWRETISTMREAGEL
jgi:UDP-glucose 4-epimerase